MDRQSVETITELDGRLTMTTIDDGDGLRRRRRRSKNNELQELHIPSILLLLRIIQEN
jgi:hypothetical protein